MAKKIIITISVALAVIVIGFVVYLFTFHNKRVYSNILKETHEYVDEEYDFSFRYPTKAWADTSPSPDWVELTTNIYEYESNSESLKKRVNLESVLKEQEAYVFIYEAIQRDLVSFEDVMMRNCSVDGEYVEDRCTVLDKEISNLEGYKYKVFQKRYLSSSDFKHYEKDMFVIIEKSLEDKTQYFLIDQEWLDDVSFDYVINSFKFL